MSDLCLAESHAPRPSAKFCIVVSMCVLNELIHNRAEVVSMCVRILNEFVLNRAEVLRVMLERRQCLAPEHRLPPLH